VCLEFEQPYICVSYGAGSLTEEVSRGGEPKPAPVETASSEWNVQRKVVVFTLLRERRFCERLSARHRMF